MHEAEEMYRQCVTQAAQRILSLLRMTVELTSKRTDPPRWRVDGNGRKERVARNLAQRPGGHLSSRGCRSSHEEGECCAPGTVVPPDRVKLRIPSPSQ